MERRMGEDQQQNLDIYQANQQVSTARRAWLTISSNSYQHEKKKMAHPKRFELLTPRFVVWCSIQLSYGCVPCRSFPAAWRSSKTSAE